MASFGEDDLIARFFKPLAGAGALGLRDDAALLSPPAGSELVLTADALVAGMHFFPGDPPASIARKALGVNISDLAAKGADPAGYLLAIALPDGWTESWLAEFCRGLAESSAVHGCPLLGGDTVRTPGPLTISITAIGAVPAGQMVRRDGAAPGDAICVTGTIGDAWLGLALSHPDGRPAWGKRLAEADASFLVDRYRHPQPRTALRSVLREHAHAAMDVSDGFSGDLAKLLSVSGLGAVIDLDDLPISAAAAAALVAEPGLRDGLLSGGDDYEVLCAVSPDRLSSFFSQAAAAGVAVAQVGAARRDTDLMFLRSGQRYPLVASSFSHL